MTRTSAIILSLALLTGCGAKKLQTDLTACQTDLAKCQATPKIAPPAAFIDARFDAYRKLAKQFRDAFGDQGISIVLRDGRMVVQLPNQIVFASGKASLSDAGKATLDKTAAILKAHPSRRFLVAGHTDTATVKEGARFTDNWELSALRATTAAKYLQSKGVAPTQIGAAGYGQYLPAAKNDTDANKAKNRRLEIIVFPTVEEMPKFPVDL